MPTGFFSMYTERNAILRTLGFATYQSYLESPTWRTIRAKVLARDRQQCQLCLGKAFSVHHRSYCRGALDGSQLHHMVSICKPCHERIEFKGEKKRLFAQVQQVFSAWAKLPKQHILRKQPSRKQQKILDREAKFQRYQELKARERAAKQAETERRRKLSIAAYDAGTRKLLGATAGA